MRISSRLSRSLANHAATSMFQASGKNMVDIGTPTQVCHPKFHEIMFIFVERLPFSIRVLLESAVRNCDEFQIKKTDVTNILEWESNQNEEDDVEVAFKPARVILQVRTVVCTWFYRVFVSTLSCYRILLEYPQSLILLAWETLWNVWQGIQIK